MFKGRSTGGACATQGDTLTVVTEMHAPEPWADEERSVLANFELNDSVFSVVRRFRDGGRRHGPPLAPPSERGEAWRNVRRGSAAQYWSALITSPLLRVDRAW